ATMAAATTAAVATAAAFTTTTTAAAPTTTAAAAPALALGTSVVRRGVDARREVVLADAHAVHPDRRPGPRSIAVAAVEVAAIEGSRLRSCLSGAAHRRAQRSPTGNCRPPRCPDDHHHRTS